MVLNKEHGDYPEFRAKWEAIVAKYEKDIAAIDARRPDWHGMDHPEAGGVTKRFHLALTALQREYGHLYEK